MVPMCPAAATSVRQTMHTCTCLHKLTQSILFTPQTRYPGRNILGHRQAFPWPVAHSHVHTSYFCISTESTHIHTFIHSYIHTFIHSYMLCYHIMHTYMLQLVGLKGVQFVRVIIDWRRNERQEIHCHRWILCRWQLTFLLRLSFFAVLCDRE